MTHALPLVYACAGCSHAGRVAYEVAQQLDRDQVAEMSCLAGVAAELPVFLRLMNGREVWVIDGCPLECARGIFENQDRPVDRHIRLREFGVAKNAAGEAEPSIRDLTDRISKGAAAGEIHSSLSRKPAVPTRGRAATGPPVTTFSFDAAHPANKPIDAASERATIE